MINYKVLTKKKNFFCLSCLKDIINIHSYFSFFLLNAGKKAHHVSPPSHISFLFVVRQQIKLVTLSMQNFYLSDHIYSWMQKNLKHFNGIFCQAQSIENIKKIHWRKRLLSNLSNKNTYYLTGIIVNYGAFNSISMCIYSYF